MRAMAFMERLAPLEVTLRPAAPRDADLLRQWRAEPSVRRFQPLNELPTAQLRADVASQRIADLYRGRGEKFQWIVQIDNQAGGWITLVVSNWEHGLAEVGYALSTIYQGRGVMGESLQILLDDLFHNKLQNLDTDWSKDSFAPIPAFIDTGSALIDKSNLQAFQQARKTMTGAQK